MNRSRLVRLAIGVVMAVVGLVSYYSYRQVNPVTGETQHITLTQDQEVALGLQSAPQMADDFGGLDPDPEVQSDVEDVGQRVVRRSVAGKTSYQFRFRVLADDETVNAFALPGGPVFITRALLNRLENEAQLAGVLGHEVGHVVGRHSAEQIATSQLAQTLVGAVGVVASGEQVGGQQAAYVAAFVAQMAQLKYGRSDELQADSLGVQLMSEAGYDPRALINVMEILARASGDSLQPEFLSSHPDPGNREESILEAIGKRFPAGVPASLILGREITLSSDGALGFAFRSASPSPPQVTAEFREEPKSGGVHQGFEGN
jgi:predicted Zn-dependent protease